jgi:hypothetical protein
MFLRFHSRDAIRALFVYDAGTELGGGEGSKYLAILAVTVDEYSRGLKVAAEPQIYLINQRRSAELGLALIASAALIRCGGGSSSQSV